MLRSYLWYVAVSEFGVGGGGGLLLVVAWKLYDARD